ncbi:1,2-dihydroxycyclohexa-3,5-diene-1-carboxylate dehydrogenase [Acidovorax delafieldii]|uniref:1,2-dihydroxycyclohexa-3,5-diene-1-carboxylate dehydrogenase n=1 Tax=Acidovorax delafieldii TaxID=47920 RepID=A0A561XV20_ACIDE|nr:1,6-dihydroxycyclohexa-2,4-diene-1-carboxylate dehydrogenase [Acidovorax delafieldii]TWG39948.1 1,2-dihydroxycyclohexa-3,5-diene-1-carboxylate dehydrogenase [Acidovorax delafieldii]
MNQRFEGKVMLITGAAQGIGERVAERAAAEGATLALVDRSPLVRELRDRLAEVTRVIAIETDLEKFEGAQQAAEATHKAFGRIDVLVNNVGGTIWTKPYEHYGPDEIEAEVRRSLFPTLWGCRAVLPYMLKKKKGAIVNVSSIATRSVNRVPYGAAKGGVNAMTACLAFENGERGIRINAVAPGGTEAPPRRIPRNSAKPSKKEQAWYQQIVDQTVDSTLMKRYGTLDEQASAILFLASDESSYITGTVIPVGGGDQG